MMPGGFGFFQTSDRSELRRLNVMCVGDSLTGLLAIYDQEMIEWGEENKLTFIGPLLDGDFHHDGRSGWSSFDHYDPEFVNPPEPTLQMQLPYLLSEGGFEADIVVVNVGTNDGLDQLAYIPSFIDSLSSIVAVTLAARPNAAIVLTSMLPNGQASMEAVRPFATAATEQLVEDLVGDGIKAIFGNLYALLAPFNQSQFTDQTHPTQNTYQTIIAAAYKQYILQAAGLVR